HAGGEVPPDQRGRHRLRRADVLPQPRHRRTPPVAGGLGQGAGGRVLDLLHRRLARRRQHVPVQPELPAGAAGQRRSRQLAGRQGLAVRPGDGGAGGGRHHRRAEINRARDRQAGAGKGAAVFRLRGVHHPRRRGQSRSALPRHFRPCAHPRGGLRRLHRRADPGLPPRRVLHRGRRRLGGDRAFGLAYPRARVRGAGGAVGAVHRYRGDLHHDRAGDRGHRHVPGRWRGRRRAADLDGLCLGTVVVPLPAGGVGAAVRLLDHAGLVVLRREGDLLPVRRIAPGGAGLQAAVLHIRGDRRVGQPGGGDGLLRRDDPGDVGAQPDRGVPAGAGGEARGGALPGTGAQRRDPQLPTRAGDRMSARPVREPSLLQALAPLLFLSVALALGVYLYADNSSYGANQISLLLAAGIAAIIGLRNGLAWDEIQGALVHGVSIAVVPIFILLAVGALIGTWRLSGTGPMMIAYGMKLLHPAYFYPATCLICAIVALTIGSSWTVAGTLGVALIGVAQGLDMSLPITAGAIISGAYFGDKMSPLSDTTNIAPAAAGS